MRGTQGAFRNPRTASGIIPAYAGNTTRLNVMAVSVRDHPRVCGEHRQGILGADGRRGSSPRMRGTLMAQRATALALGIIPAYAGNTPHSMWKLLLPRDHPRVCGEHWQINRKQPQLTGSSPRMRGTLLGSIRALAFGGIIPAYAGNTAERYLEIAVRRDHPRVCGEHICPCPSAVIMPGSSPRMRGTRIGILIMYETFGIIPAYAGNTCSASMKSPPTRDHPRVCGEHSNSMGAITMIAGSSPRMRGTPKTDRPLPYAQGIIPAYAGNTG